MRALLVLFATCLALPAFAAAPPRSSPNAASAEAADPWTAMLAAATPAVVSIDITQTRAFDGERAGHGFATGFVVDAERGLVLTNRHVVTPAPVRAEMILQDNEVIPLQAVYRDPVHDFGFYHYDPALVKYAKLPALELDPSGARVGTEIRVVGNNAGEKLSIHTGTIARLDRDAPRYGRDGFNDFNTFYLQAAAGTTGGSSGSPVLDVRGKVVALNAGSRRDSAASFYLPLDRVVRALRLVQAGQAVPRGSIHAVFGYASYDEVHRLGVREETEAEARARNPDAIGMLAVREILPGGPADGKLAVGDVLLAVGGQAVAGFLPLDAALDDHVGDTVHLAVERGGRPIEVDLPVADLHAVSPAEYVEFAGDVLHALSYQQARNNNVPVRGVYLASGGYGFGQSGIPDGARIDAVDGKPTPTLDEAWRVLGGLADGARVEVRYVRLSEPRRVQVASIRIERRLFPMRRCVRRDTDGTWPCTDASPAPPATPHTAATVRLEAAPKGPAGAVAHALVWVDARLPFVLAGNGGDFYTGVGVIVDRAKGLVLVDRDTVPQSLAEVSVVVGGTQRLSARPVYFHPDHNLAVIQYDPALLGDTPVTEASFDGRRPEVGEAVWQVGLNARQGITWSATHVKGYSPFILASPNVPSFRDHDLELLNTVDPALEKGGVVVDARGKVRALLASFVEGSGKSQSSRFMGLPADILLDVVAPLRAGRPGPARALGAAWRQIPLSTAVDLGLGADEAARLAATGRTRVALVLTHLEPGTDAAKQLREGDILLSVDGKSTASWRNLDKAAMQPAAKLVVWRDGHVVPLSVATHVVSTTDLDRASVWAGALLHAPYRAMLLQQGGATDGVYVTWRWFGSPADRYGLDPTTRIVAVDDTPVADLAAFKAAVQGRADREVVRVRAVDLDGREEVVALRLDTTSWAPYDLVRTGERWERVAW